MGSSNYHSFIFNPLDAFYTSTCDFPRDYTCVFNTLGSQSAHTVTYESLFFHSLYPRFPPVLKLLGGLPLPLSKILLRTLAPIVWWIALCENIGLPLSFSGSGPNRCAHFSNSDSENARILPSPVNVSPSFTVGTCLNTCVALKFPLAGVENGLSCCTCFTCRCDKQALLTKLCC